MSHFGRQSEGPSEGAALGRAAEFHLLGQADFEACQALQRRLVYEAGGRADGRIVVLICEHSELITVGRNGSRGHIRMRGEQLRRANLPIRWVARGGGCILHRPGQLAVYPIVPLAPHGWTVGEYLGRLQAGILAALQELHVPGQTRPGRFSIWGRSGVLAAVGAAVRFGVSCQGVFLNVNPAMSHFGAIDVVPPETVLPGEKTTMGCLLAERRHGVRMSGVRAALVHRLAAALGCQRHFLYTGHPLLAPLQRSACESAARAC